MKKQNIKLDEVVFYGKAGKDSERHKGCMSLLGVTFPASNLKASQTALQVTKAKVILPDGSRVGKMKMLGCIAEGKYKGQLTVVQLPDTEGKDRTDFAVKVLDKCDVKTRCRNHIHKIDCQDEYLAGA